MNPIIYNAICNEIDFLIRQKNQAVLVIDGMSGAGKSSFAQLLSEKYQAAIVHMDHFFLPPDLRSEERLAQPGGNIHYERFREEALPAILQRKSFSYRRFDCHRMDYVEMLEIPAAKLLIVEGAYAMHPEFGHYFDMALFMDVEEETQLQRIKERSGEEALAQFKERWIPFENAYFKACQVIERCDHIIEY